MKQISVVNTFIPDVGDENSSWEHGECIHKFVPVYLKIYGILSMGKEICMVGT